MAKQSSEQVAEPVSGSRTLFILGALVLGLIAGMAANASGDGLREPLLQAAGVVGGLWLDALKMTVIPLIVALLVTGIVKGAAAARGGRVAARTVIWIVAICTLSAVVGAVAMPVLLSLFPLPAQAADALRTGLAALDPSAASGAVPSVADFFKDIIPPNVIAAAANDQVLQLVIFALVFALAIGRIGTEGRDLLLRFFEALADALLVVIGWVLWIAPIGVLALAFTVGAGAGGAAFAGLIHYILLVSAVGILMVLVGYIIAIFAGRVPPGRFIRAIIAPQSLAVSTQSSLACLPAMLATSRELRVREEVADVSLPLAVALFRGTGPAMNYAVAFYVAHWFGIDPSWPQVIAATAVAAVASYGAISLPGQISFVTSIGPIALALGVPIAPLALLVAVETIPDIFRTVGNVTLDVGVTAAVDCGLADEA